MAHAITPSSDRRIEKIVFACVHSAGRSQMAAAFFNRLAAPDRARALAAGTRPASHVHPEVVATMGEVGIDLRHARPELLTGEVAHDAAWLVTMGCGEECPVVPGVRREDWSLPDPKGQDVASVRAIRDDVRSRVEAFVDREGYAAVRVEISGRQSAGEMLAFLAANGLPDAGLAEHATDLLFARVDRRVVGTAALEEYGEDALLRSVAVASDLRGTGLGQRLVRAAIRRARERGVKRLFLLTETASGFFPKFGFAGVDRATVPSSVRGSVEFASACPAGARVMVLDLA